MDRQIFRRLARNAAYPQGLLDEEASLLRVRRAKVGLPDPEAGDAPVLGVAVSGGGIRSATFALGLFQALARTPVFQHLDFLSTVSGGSYFGAFLGGLFTPREEQEPGGGAGKSVADILADTSRPQNQWLRDNGRYLAPAGGGDILAAGAAYLRNLVTIHVVLGALALALFLAAFVLRAALPHQPMGWMDWWENWLFRWIPHGFWPSPYFALPIIVIVAFVLPLGWAFWLMPGQSGGWWTIWPWLSLPGTVFAVLPFLWNGTWRSVFLAVAVPVLVGLFGWAARLRGHWCALKGEAKPPVDDVVGVRRTARNRLSVWLSWAILVAMATFAFALFDSAGQTLWAYVSHYQARDWSLWTVLPAALGPVLPPLVKRFFARLGTRESARPGLPLSVVGGVAAAVLLLVYLSVAAMAAHGIAWRGEPDGQPGALIAGGKGPRPCAVALSTEDHVEVKGAPCAPALPPLQAPVLHYEASLWALLAAVAASILFGRSWSFLNLSTFQALYAGRLTRAYLGASNPKRWADGAGNRRLSDPVPGDDIALARYRPFEQGGPLHLINVTINETVDGETQTEYRDRKGIGLAVGPAGLSAGIRHHALWNLKPSPKVGWLRGLFFRRDDRSAKSAVRPTMAIAPLGAGTDRFQMFAGYKNEACVEQLPLGSWVGISGAAVSTALGYRTSIGLSLLAGMFNIRLGYWWDSYCIPSKRPEFTPTAGLIDVNRWLTGMFPVQLYLIDEWLARFRGSARRLWNLTDGGHFENTGAYELIRRRLPFIVVLDDGEDPEWELADLANLVRKVRLDFGAEVTFLSKEALTAQELPPWLRSLLVRDASRWITTIDGLRQRDTEAGQLLTSASQGHAALATVAYADDEGGPVSWLLVVKPTLTRDEPLDVVQYRRTRPKFPQEPTTDQFFDEAQWESYRRLGEHIGRRLFGGDEPRTPTGEGTPSGDLGAASGTSPGTRYGAVSTGMLLEVP